MGYYCFGNATLALSAHVQRTDGTAHYDSGIAAPLVADVSGDVAGGQLAMTVLPSRRCQALNIGTSSLLEVASIAGIAGFERAELRITTSSSTGLSMIWPPGTLVRGPGLSHAGTLRCLVSMADLGNPMVVQFPEDGDE